MRKQLLDQFKVCQKHFQNVLNDLESKSTSWDWAKYYDKTHAEMKSTIAVLGVLIERVDADARGEGG